MKDLILVESPTKAKTLNTFLKGKFDIEASMGHIRDLPKSKIGVDIDNNFEPEYVISPDKEKILNHLYHIVKEANTVILATDPDREGEAIAYHLYKLLKEKAKKATDFKRIVFHEITQEAIDEALTSPRKIDNHLVDAQTARRVLDRIVGYKLSPLLWKKIRRNLSAGRVQSVALRLIVEREREIEKFESKEFYRVFVLLAKSNKAETEFELVEIINSDLPRQGVKAGKLESTQKVKLYDGDYTYTTTSLTPKKAGELVELLSKKDYKVLEVIRKDTKRSPYPPYITSTLQIEASRRLGFTSKKTMSFAQKLYEEGFITYHRTDSFNLSQQFLNRARAFIKSNYGEKYLSDSPRVYQTKSKVAQEAHEAIRPTKVEDLETLKKQVNDSLDRDATRLFELIYKRAVATQMSDALFESIKVRVGTKVNQDEFVFEKNGSILKFDGFLKLWFYEEKDELMPDFVQDEKLHFVNCRLSSHTTNPPPRYSEAGLISALEKNGIGRPSTYSSIVSTIQERQYVERQDARFIPTPVGSSVNDFLVKNFSTVDDIPFTAQMEDQLDEVANGERSWIDSMKEFYKPFEESLKKAEGSERVEVPAEKTDKKCPECKEGDLVVRYSRFGKFLACSRFPECKYKASFIEETQFICPKDGGKVIVRKTRRGRIFYGCTNYPKCDFATWKLTDLKKAQEHPTPDTSS